MRDFVKSNWILLAMMIGVLGGITSGYLSSPPQEAVQAAETTITIGDPATGEVTTFKKVKEAAAEDGGLTRRQRKKLGITFRNIRRVAKELKANGELSDNTALASAEVLEVLTNENPKGFKDEAAAIDWDALLAFIEKLMAIIMKFFVF